MCIVYGLSNEIMHVNTYIIVLLHVYILIEGENMVQQVQVLEQEIFTFYHLGSFKE